MEETVILILGENRIEVNKKKLADKTIYFGCLFLSNFNDSHKKEHVINYEIDLCTLQNFVEWIHNETSVDICHHSINSSLTKFVQDNFAELLNLLQFSKLFIADKLTNEIVEIIALFWLLPEKVIDIWVLAQELHIKVLRDISLAVCLDRFEELPVSCLITLSKDYITQLIANSNVRSSTNRLNVVRSCWIKYQMNSDIIEINEKRQPKFIQGTVFYETCEASKIAYLYTWDGNTLSKCMQLQNIQYSGRCLVGMQVISRGYSIYTVGGEIGIGTGVFNETIWRYCLLSKKRYYQAKLPVPRRHMIAIFLGNKLVLVGGVGRHRLKLFTVDILNIHTGTWEKGAPVPESFTDVPPHCVLNGKLFLVKSSVYIYCPKENYWLTILIHNSPAIQTVDSFLTRDTTLFLIGTHLDETILSRIDVAKDSVCKRIECSKQLSIDHSVVTNTNVLVVYKGDSFELRYAHIADVGVLVLNDYREEKHQYLHLHTERRSDLKNSYIPKLGCFNIMDPHTI